MQTMIPKNAVRGGLFAAFLCGTALMLAQPVPPGSPGYERRRGEPLRRAPASEVQRMSPPERPAMRPALPGAAEVARELREHMQQLHRRLHNQLWSPQPDRQAIREIAEEIGRVQTKMVLARARAIASVRANLTPERRERMRMRGPVLEDRDPGQRPMQNGPGPFPRWRAGEREERPAFQPEPPRRPRPSRLEEGARARDQGDGWARPESDSRGMQDGRRAPDGQGEGAQPPRFQARREPVPDGQGMRFRRGWQERDSRDRDEGGMQPPRPGQEEPRRGPGRERNSPEEPKTERGERDGQE